MWKALPDSREVRLEAGQAPRTELQVFFDGHEPGHEGGQIGKLFQVRTKFDVAEERLALGDGGNVLRGRVAEVVLPGFTKCYSREKKVG